MPDNRQPAATTSRPDRISRSRLRPDARALSVVNERKPLLALIVGGNAAELNAAAVAAPAGDHSPFVLFIR